MAEKHRQSLLAEPLSQNDFLNLVISYWILVVHLTCYEWFRDILVTLYNHSGNLHVFFRFSLYHPMRDNLFIMFEIQDLFYSRRDGWFHLLNLEGLINTLCFVLCCFFKTCFSQIDGKQLVRESSHPLWYIEASDTVKLLKYCLFFFNSHYFLPVSFLFSFLVKEIMVTDRNYTCGLWELLYFYCWV